MPTSIAELSTQVFVGFRLNPDTGTLLVEILDGDVAVVIPEQMDPIVDKYGYSHWLFTKETLRFEWADDNKHLLLQFV